jgi:hypothetical protein
MPINTPYISSTQVASSTPFDPTTGVGYVGSDVQSVLQELRDYTIHSDNITATTVGGTLQLTAPVAGGDTTTGRTLQILTGTATGYSVEMPSALGLSVGANYIIGNTTTQPVTIKDGAGTTLFSLSETSVGYLFLQAGGSAGGTWLFYQISATASGVTSYNVVSSTAFSTTSTTNVVITGFTVTPQSGTYAVWVNGSWTPQAGPGNLETVTIYNNGASVADSVRSQSPIQSLDPSLMSTQTITQVNGSQAIDVRINSSSGQNLTVNQRSLLLIRLGP